MWTTNPQRQYREVAQKTGRHRLKGLSKHERIGILPCRRVKNEKACCGLPDISGDGAGHCLPSCVSADAATVYWLYLYRPNRQLHHFPHSGRGLVLGARLQTPAQHLRLCRDVQPVRMTTVTCGRARSTTPPTRPWCGGCAKNRPHHGERDHRLAEMNDYYTPGPTRSRRRSRRCACCLPYDGRPGCPRTELLKISSSGNVLHTSLESLSADLVLGSTTCGSSHVNGTQACARFYRSGFSLLCDDFRCRVTDAKWLGFALGRFCPMPQITPGGSVTSGLTADARHS